MEADLVILKPAELFLKSEPVMRRMMNTLFHNVKVALKQTDVVFDHIAKERLRISISTPETDEVIEATKRVFGIATITPAVVVGTAIEALRDTALELARDAGLTSKKSFAVRVNRVDKSGEFTSKELEIDVGSHIQNATKSKVDLTNPNVEVGIELYKGKAYMSTKSERGLGGLPVGVSGKVVCLMDGKPECVAAAWMMLKRGCEILPLHFRADEKAQQLFINNCKKLEKFAIGSSVKASSIKSELDIKAAEKFAAENDAKALVFGDSEVKGRIASLPIFTPLIGLAVRRIKEIEKLIGF